MLRQGLHGSDMDGLTGGVMNVGMRGATASLERHAAKHRLWDRRLEL